MFKPKRTDYLANFNKLVISPKSVAGAEAAANRILANKSRYQEVEKNSHVPWFVVGLLHYRESDFSFTTWLANGDSLKAATHHVPKGLTVPGQKAPYTWEGAAYASVKQNGMCDGRNWNDFNVVAGSMEAYNGYGYLMRHTQSPYLYSGSNIHEKGKYVADGKYDPNAIDEQLGTLTILKVLVDKSNGDFDKWFGPKQSCTAPVEPVVAPVAEDVPPISVPAKLTWKEWFQMQISHLRPNLGLD